MFVKVLSCIRGWDLAKLIRIISSSIRKFYYINIRNPELTVDTSASSKLAEVAVGGVYDDKGKFAAFPAGGV